MPSPVQWIKITTDIFDDEKILLIDSLPDSDNILIIWFKLLCLAGKQNNKGVFLLGKTPYTPRMLSTILRRDENTIINALKLFEEYGMIQYHNGAITITNWGKHQNLDKIEANNAYMREYMREYRKKQKDVAVGKAEGKVNGKVKINSADIEINKDKEQDKEQNKEKNRELNKEISSKSSYDDCTVPLELYLIINSFHSICKSLPRIIKITKKREETIKKAKQTLGEFPFEQLFEKVEKSDFLTGRTDGKWRCDFDWIMKPENIIKILEGNYDNKIAPVKNDYCNVSKYTNLDMEV